MKSTRMVTVAALALGAALTFTGCAAEAAPAVSTDNQACSEVRNITNGALNTLAGDLAADPAGKSDYFAQLSERVEALHGTVDNAQADAAFSSFSAALGEASAYVATVSTEAPAADAETDPALIAATAAVQETAADAAANCSAE